MTWFLLGLLLFSNWLWFVAFRAYRKEILKHLRKKGYDQYAYTNDWWIINRDADPGNMRVAGPFSSAQDAGKCREILERKTNTNINYWVKRIEEVENGKSSS